MKIEYYPATDNLYIRFREGEEAYGREVERGMVFHYDETGDVVSLEMDSFASKLVDIETLEVGGLDRVVSTHLSETEVARHG